MFRTTPDLSAEFHPQPKTFKSKKPKAVLKAGKKTLEWDAARKELKKLFESKGITSCELKLDNCWRKNALTFAHIDKRQNLSPDEIYSVALACQSCHEKIERLPHEKMRKMITRIIEKRGW